MQQQQLHWLAGCAAWLPAPRCCAPRRCSAAQRALARPRPWLLPTPTVACAPRSWERFAALRAVFAAYCATLADFKKNQLSAPEGELEALVRRRWAASFRELGYE